MGEEVETHVDVHGLTEEEVEAMLMKKLKDIQ
jgi:hypothetical protein